MKIVHSKMKHRKRISLPNKINVIKNFKSKARKRAKNQEIKSISKLVNSLDKTKISYFDSPCGTIECVEKVDINRSRGNGFDQEIPSCSYSSADSIKLRPNERSLKPRKRKARKLKSENRSNQIISSLSPKSSIVKMTCDSNGKKSGNTILQLCSATRKIANTESSVLASLILAGMEVKESAIEESNAEKMFEQSEVLIPRTDSKHLQITTGTPFQAPNSDEMIIKGSHNSINSPVCSIVVDSNDINSVANFYTLGCSTFLVVMKPGGNLAIIGTVEIQLLKGSIEVLGYNSYNEDEKLLIFSLQGSSHLSVKAKDCNKPLGDQKSDINLYEKLITLGLSETLSLKVSRKAESCTLFTVTRQKTHISSSVWPKFFENHSSFFVFPNTHLFSNGSRPCHAVERKIKCLFESNLQELGLKEFRRVPEWSAIERDILDNDYPKAILCGGKSVGKSSLLRYLVNKCLSKWKQILVLDFDSGQCEFTVPGCISATLVEEPLLGPNYSHLKQPKRSVYLGEVDVTKCPENYIDGCKSLIDYAKHKHGDIPWLINTMGFTKGFGVSLACGITNYVSPTHVIQIQSRDRTLNFPSLLEPKFVTCLKHSAFDVENNTLAYQLYEIMSGSEQQGFVSKSRGISPAESRNLVILSYLSRMLNSSIPSLSQVTPYMINIDQVGLHTTNKYSLTKDQVAAAMNGSLVALCHKRPHNSFKNCVGFGIVRSVDWQNRKIFLITPLPQAELRKVTCLVKGNVGLPDSLYYNQGNQVTGHVPYLANTSGGPTTRFAKRDYRMLPATQR